MPLALSRYLIILLSTKSSFSPPFTYPHHIYVKLFYCTHADYFIPFKVSFALWRSTTPASVFLFPIALLKELSFLLGLFSDPYIYQHYLIMLFGGLLSLDLILLQTRTYFIPSLNLWSLNLEMVFRSQMLSYFGQFLFRSIFPKEDDDHLRTFLIESCQSLLQKDQNHLLPWTSDTCFYESSAPSRKCHFTSRSSGLFYLEHAAFLLVHGLHPLCWEMDTFTQAASAFSWSPWENFSCLCSGPQGIRSQWPAPTRYLCTGCAAARLFFYYHLIDH